MSVTQACVKETSKKLFAILKSDGFRRKSPHIYRERYDVFHVINFQCSQWGGSDEGTFTVNLAVTGKNLYETWTGRPFPRNPGSATWPISKRIGYCIGNNDLWWSVDRSTDIEKFSRNVADEISKPILTFFSQYESLEVVSEAFKNSNRKNKIPGVFEAQIPLILAILYKNSGNTEEARKMLIQSYEENRGCSFQQTILCIADRIGVDLPNKSSHSAS